VAFNVPAAHTSLPPPPPQETLKIWDLDTGNPINTIHGHKDAVLACAASANGTHIFSGR